MDRVHTGRVTVADVRSAYPPEKRAFNANGLWVSQVIRPLSFYVSWFFIRLEVTANQTTYLSILVGSIGCVLLAIGGYSLSVAGALLINVWYLLDCTDGNIARFHQTTSPYGKFIDDFGAYWMRGALYFALGLGLFGQPDGFAQRILIDALRLSNDGVRGLLLACGAIASLAVTLKQAVALKYQLAFGAPAFNEDEQLVRLLRGWTWLRRNILYPGGILLPLLLLAAVTEALSLFALFYASVLVLALALAITRYIRQAHQISS